MKAGWITAVTLVALCAGLPAAAQEWPTRAVTLVVPFGPGSGADNGARTIARHFTEYTGQPFTVENRPGFNGAIATQAVARAKPDGYTLVIGSAATHATNYAFYPGKLGYEPSSFDAAAGLGYSPILLFVGPTFAGRSVADVIAEAKRQPGKLSCGSGNTVTQVACEAFRKAAGIDIVNVPYKSNPLSLNDLAGSQISMAFADASVALPYLSRGAARAGGVAAAQRLSSQPDVPTFREQGIPGFEITAWTAVFAPAGTPPAVLERINALVRRSNDSKEAVELREKTGSSAFTLSVAQTRQFVADEVERWARYIRETGVKAE